MGNKPAPEPEYLYAVLGDIWNSRRVARARILKRTANSVWTERGHAVGFNARISFDECRRRGITGSAHAAIIEWRAQLKKKRDELLDEIAQIEKVLARPDPKVDFE